MATMTLMIINLLSSGGHEMAAMMLMIINFINAL